MASTVCGESSNSSRTFPPPASISVEAQQALLRPWPSHPHYPELHDEPGWQAFITSQNEAFHALWPADLLDQGATAAEDMIAGVRVIRTKPTATLPIEGKVYLDIHGGALIFCGGAYLRPLAQMAAIANQANVVSVDYRMPPAHPYPAGLDDCLAVYRELANEIGAANIIVGGASAGGNLALALMLRARDEGIALPAGLVLMTPEVDLTESGDSFQVLAGIDRLEPLMPVNLIYAAGAPLDHPYLSPLFGEFSAEFPPTFIQSGTRDLFLSNAVRLHRKMRKAKVEAELHIWEALPHGKFFSAPEDDEIDTEVRNFIMRCWRSAA